MKPKVDFLKRQQIDKRLTGLTKGKKWRLKLLKPGIKEEALLMILQGNKGLKGNNTVNNCMLTN